MPLDLQWTSGSPSIPLISRQRAACRAPFAEMQCGRPIDRPPAPAVLSSVGARCRNGRAATAPRADSRPSPVCFSVAGFDDGACRDVARPTTRKRADRTASILNSFVYCLLGISFSDNFLPYVESRQGQCGDVRCLTHINEAVPSPRKMDARDWVLREHHTGEPALAINRRDQQVRNMGIGMQIAYFGFAGSARLEAEASIQLMRLEPFSAQLAGCHLAIETMRVSARQPSYDVRLDLITRKGEFRPVPHMTGADPMDALKRAFDLAERQLASTAATGVDENRR